MKAIFYRSAYKSDSLPDGSWKRLLPEQEAFASKKILCNIETGKLFCPIHCRWEACTLNGEFTITCAGGKTAHGIIVPYTPEPDEDAPRFFDRNRGVLVKSHIVTTDYYYYAGYGNNLRAKYFTDKDGRSRNIFSFTIEADIEKCTCSVKAHYIDTNRFNSMNEGNFMLINIPVQEEVNFYSFITKLPIYNTHSHPLSVDYDTPEIVSAYIEAVAQKLIDKFAGRHIRINKGYFRGEKLLNALAHYPYEANMFGVMKANKASAWLSIEGIQPNWLSRTSCDVYNDWCRRYGIKSFPQHRKHFEADPLSLLYYKEL